MEILINIVATAIFINVAIGLTFAGITVDKPMLPRISHLAISREKFDSVSDCLVFKEICTKYKIAKCWEFCKRA